MANLFDKAKQSAPKKAEKHEVVDIPEIESSVAKMVELNAKIAELEAEKAILDSEIREAGKDAMIKLYNTKKSFPGTLKVKAGETSFQFISQDRYKKIDEDRFALLAKTYGSAIVEEETVYSFNTAILMKHMDHISELLMGSEQLSTSEKESLLESETSFVVKKGTINQLFSFKTVKNNVETIIEDIQPIFAIKSVQKD
jgi:hypothetical protein